MAQILLAKYNIRNLRNFIVIQYNKSKENIDIEVLDEILASLLKAHIEVIGNKNMNLTNSFINIIKDIVTIINSIESKFISKFLPLINVYIEGLLLNISNKVRDEVMISIFKVLDNNLKTKIKRYIRKKLNREFNIELYHEVIMEKVIKSNIQFEELLIKEIDKIIESNSKSTIQVFPNPVDKTLEMSVNLLINNLLINPMLFYKYKGINDKFDLFMDIENFDYQKFKIEWVKDFPEWVHEKLAQVKVARNAIKEMFKKLMIDGNISKRSKAIYFKYYD